MGYFKELNTARVYDSTDAQVRDSYHAWLESLIMPNNTDAGYGMLYRRLHTIAFVWSVPNDDNREADAFELRERFVRDNDLGSWEAWTLQGEASVFEVLVALAIRFADIMTEDDDEPINKYFWTMITNLGLGTFTDWNYHYVGGHFEVNKTIINWILREYAYNGEGGVFPLTNPQEDQRKVELWYQMHAYINETYRHRT